MADVVEVQAADTTAEPVAVDTETAPPETTEAETPPEPEPKRASLARLVAREAQLRRREMEIEARERTTQGLDMDALRAALESGDDAGALRALGRDPSAAYLKIAQGLMDGREGDDPVAELRRSHDELRAQIAAQQKALEESRIDRALRDEQARLARYVESSIATHPVLAAAVTAGVADHAGIAGDLLQIKSEEYVRTKRTLDDGAASAILAARLQSWLDAADRLKSSLPRTEAIPQKAGDDAPAARRTPRTADLPRRGSAAQEAPPDLRSMSLDERLALARRKLAGGGY